jgi:hypothetical protein
MRRRDFLTTFAAMGGASALGLPRWARAWGGSTEAGAAMAHANDWAWLRGDWKVWHRRLKERLQGDTTWEEFAGRSAVWLVMDGLGTIDDNIVELPGGAYRGLGIRAFDAAVGKWSIWWLDGRNPTHIDPPVRGGFEGDTGTFIGHDTFKGRPIVMRFRWRDIHGARPWWEQAFSPDDGASWEVNWRNWFTRTSTTPTPLPSYEDAPRDWDFLVGRWRVRHRRLRQRFAGSDRWDEFDGTLVNWPVLGGHGNVGDNLMRFPDTTVRGVGIRAFDPATRQWLSWWLDGRRAGEIAPPLRGGFADGVGTFLGDDNHEGRPVRTRVVWSQITPHSARWEQSGSADDGASWESNWVSEFTRLD